AQAPALHAGLQLARELVLGGTVEAGELSERIRKFYASSLPDGQLDYLEIVDPDTLTPLSRIRRRALVAVAMHLGKARLIDNTLIE
ncbi:MAG TPA: pantoate--beta-alanine ligase, partial [Desulfomicrobiaceae bacterium]|nr:pantoate--beta-alanine ligase [Desulfomicrobiaceae bacterium]